MENNSNEKKKCSVDSGIRVPKLLFRLIIKPWHYSIQFSNLIIRLLNHNTQRFTSPYTCGTFTNFSAILVMFFFISLKEFYQYFFFCFHFCFWAFKCFRGNRLQTKDGNNNARVDELEEPREKKEEKMKKLSKGSPKQQKYGTFSRILNILARKRFKYKYSRNHLKMKTELRRGQITKTYSVICLNHGGIDFEILFYIGYLT